jgi:hypothetical protein
MTESLIPQDALSMVSQSRGFASASTSGGKSGDSRKGRTQELLDVLTPTEKVTASESELEEAAKRCVFFVNVLHAADFLHSFINQCRAKEYSRQKMRQHRAWQAEFMTKVKLRDAALAALPESLREAAMAPDLTPFPSTRQVWMETPPHEKGDSKQVQQEDTDKRKRKIGTKL